MAGEWKTARFEDIAEKIAMGPFGSNIKVETFVETGIPVISGAHLRKVRLEDGDFNFVTDDHAQRMKNSNVFRGDVIFTHAGNIGQVAHIPPNSEYERYVISQRQFYLRCDLSKADPAFVSYFFHSNEGQHKLLANASQTGVPSIARPSSYLKTIEISLPPLPEQRAIAYMLGTLDDKIELIRRLNQTLEAMARALFRDWFVDFGPVRAKMSGQEPYLPADRWQLFPDRLDDAGKPEGWEKGTLADLASLNPESWSKSNAPEVIEYVDLANTKLGTIESVARLPWSEAPSRAQRILRSGDTIVGTVRPGNGSYALVGAEGLTASTGFAVLRPKQPFYREFVLLAATSAENIERLSHLADGAAYPAVRPDVVLASPVAKPDQASLDGLMKAFSKMAGEWIDTMEHNKVQSETLAQLRDILLPKLISGDLRITDAATFMKRVEALAT